MKLTATQIQQVQERYATGKWTKKQLAKKFGVSEYQINKATRGIVNSPQTVLQRFNEKWTEDVNGCHIWNACTDKDGYGLFKMSDKAMRAHRVSYQLHKEEIPKGQTVRHICDNTKCVNPDHLILGTQKQNVQDKIERFRDPWQFESIEYLEMKFFFEIGVSEHVIAERFGITKETLKRRLNDMDKTAVDPAEDRVFYYRDRAIYEETMKGKINPPLELVIDRIIV
jgi:transposase